MFNQLMTIDYHKLFIIVIWFISMVEYAMVYFLTIMTIDMNHYG